MIWTKPPGNYVNQPLIFSGKEQKNQCLKIVALPGDSRFQAVTFFWGMVRLKRDPKSKVVEQVTSI